MRRIGEKAYGGHAELGATRALWGVTCWRRDDLSSEPWIVETTPSALLLRRLAAY
jgi:hypothetical protein